MLPIFTKEMEMAKRDFDTVLTAFLVAAAAGTLVGGAKQAKAATGPAAAVICDDEFCQFFENFDQFQETPPFQQFFREGPTPFFENFLQVVEPPIIDLPDFPIGGLR